jgi:hypothetical protein
MIMGDNTVFTSLISGESLRLKNFADERGPDDVRAENGLAPAVSSDSFSDRTTDAVRFRRLMGGGKPSELA